ncbi:hypothetical protein [Rhodoferax sp.]|uniref:hypothetical protein n=1 Tax=Rhodoferax sp. TaxID=50421 RepID=UPI0025D9332D|nr:hypothetical protein [Rhodoferax sp.]MCM2342257.1 hypothetical protein [Rhodoferax sp.]
MSVVLDQPCNGSLLTGFQRLMLVPLVILFFAACTDGYPKEDELIINPLELSQSQRLQAMNQLGQDAHPEIKWIYRALPSCTMQITVNGSESGKQTFSLEMSGAGVDISFNKVEQIYGVKVKPKQGDTLEEQPVLLSKTWLDAIEMSNLVRSFQIGCQSSTAPVSINNTNPL